MQNRHLPITGVSTVTKLNQRIGIGLFGHFVVGIVVFANQFVDSRQRFLDSGDLFLTAFDQGSEPFDLGSMMTPLIATKEMDIGSVLRSKPKEVLAILVDDRLPESFGLLQVRACLNLDTLGPIRRAGAGNSLARQRILP